MGEDKTICVEKTKYGGREFLSLVSRLEKYDAQKMEWIGELALLRKVSLDSLLKQLGLVGLELGLEMKYAVSNFAE